MRHTLKHDCTKKPFSFRIKFESLCIMHFFSHGCKLNYRVSKERRDQNHAYNWHGKLFNTGCINSRRRTATDHANDRTSVRSDGNFSMERIKKIAISKNLTRGRFTCKVFFRFCKVNFINFLFQRNLIPVLPRIKNCTRTFSNFSASVFTECLIQC